MGKFAGNYYRVNEQFKKVYEKINELVDKINGGGSKELYLIDIYHTGSYDYEPSTFCITSKIVVDINGVEKEEFEDNMIGVIKLDKQPSYNNSALLLIDSSASDLIISEYPENIIGNKIDSSQYPRYDNVTCYPILRYMDGKVYLDFTSFAPYGYFIAEENGNHDYSLYGRDLFAGKIAFTRVISNYD